MMLFGSRASETIGPAITLLLIYVYPVIAMFLFWEYRRHGKYKSMNTVQYIIPLFRFLQYSRTMKDKKEAKKAASFVL